IITQGEVYQRIYQINRGHCRIELNKEGTSVKLGVMKQDETFGEISFLNQGKGASASVIADADDSMTSQTARNSYSLLSAALTMIEGYYIYALVDVDTAFAGRFCKDVVILRPHTVKERQKASS